MHVLHPRTRQSAPVVWRRWGSPLAVWGHEGDVRRASMTLKRSTVAARDAAKCRSSSSVIGIAHKFCADADHP